MTHNKAVRRMYQDRGLMPIPERQNYEALNQQRRRLGEQVAVQQAKLTQENTRPIRILPNYDLMYENKVRPNRVCFTLGAWVKRGNPESSAPSDESLATCHRSWRSDLSAYVEVAANLQNQDCWAVCGPEDTQTDINRECALLRRIWHILGLVIARIYILSWDLDNQTSGNLGCSRAQVNVTIY